MAADEARYELQAFKREQAGEAVHSVGPPPMAPPSTAAPLPNFMKRQLALEQGRGYTPQWADGTRGQAAASPTIAAAGGSGAGGGAAMRSNHPRSNLSSVNGGIFGHYQ